MGGAHTTTHTSSHRPCICGTVGLNSHQNGGCTHHQSHLTLFTQGQRKQPCICGTVGLYSHQNGGCTHHHSHLFTQGQRKQPCICGTVGLYSHQNGGCTHHHSHLFTQALYLWYCRALLSPKWGVHTPPLTPLHTGAT